VSKVVIVTSTLYKGSDDVRAKLAIETICSAKEHGYPIVIVDSSPEEIRDSFRGHGAIVFDAEKQGMGIERRQAIRETTGLAGPDGIVAWMEPEKTPFVPLLGQVVKELIAQSADLAIPRRRSLESYPEIQQHAEWLGNEAFRMLTGMALDVWFGPRVFRSNIASFFLDYRGEYGDLWDSIFVPIIRAIKTGKKVIGVEVDYIHPKEQTAIEDDFPMFEKRINQLVTLIETIRTEARSMA